MNPFLITPAAAAATTAAHGAFSQIAGVGAAVGIGSNPATTATSGGSDFSQQLAAARSMTGTTPSGLAGLTPAQLRQKLASLSPDQQVALAQQLMGSKVGVADFSGHVTTGVADKLQIQNGVPTFQVSGHSYSLSSLVAVGGNHVA